MKERFNFKEKSDPLPDRFGSFHYGNYLFTSNAYLSML